MNRWLPVLLALLLFPAASLAHSEKEHADALCAGFDAIELRNDDGTRTDCLNAQFAVEVDYTYKWAEGVGQALYYAELHQRTPGIIFVCHPETTDELCDKHVKRAIRSSRPTHPSPWSGVAGTKTHHWTSATRT